MLRNVLKGVAGLALLATAGCIDVSTVVKVKKDGSGEIVQTIFLSQALTSMMNMAQTMGDENAKPPSLIKEDELRDKAHLMGEGVTFTSAKEVQRKDGSKGVRAVFAFTDVTKLKVDPMGDMQGGAMGGMQGPPPGKDSGESISFAFQKGPAPTLTIRIPQDAEKNGPPPPPPPAVAEEAADIPDQPGDMPGGQEMAMMRQMFEGMRVRFYVMVEGEIQNTNASYTEKSRNTGKEQFIALLDLNFGELMKDPEKFKKLSAMGQPTDPAKMKDALKEFKEIKIETKPEVQVTFQ